ncbi:MAG TPA: type II toxin-antitoxin system VapC family toxin [Candidatus Binatia bacterium]|nr:type II toxin-antitoxin system VapC family toxin [Candidatus Binatia bacterium]
MRLLLDTHAFLWWLDGDRRLPARVRALIGEPASEVLVSAASVWEIALKARLGKLPRATEVAADVPACIESQGFVALSITVHHAQRAGALAGRHRDPFDRMLVVQAQAEGVPIATNETLFEHYGVTRLW